MFWMGTQLSLCLTRADCNVAGFVPFYSVREWWDWDKMHLKQWGRRTFTGRLAQLWAGLWMTSAREWWWWWRWWWSWQETWHCEQALECSLWRQNKWDPISYLNTSTSTVGNKPGGIRVCTSHRHYRNIMFPNKFWHTSSSTHVYQNN